MNSLAVIYFIFGLLFSFLFSGFYLFIKAKKIFSHSLVTVGVLMIGFLFTVLIIGMSSQLNEVHALFLLMMAIFFLMMCQLMVLVIILFKSKKRRKKRKKEVKK
ncbi:hypothetical protein CKN73_00395 [Carnobacterium divergens]|uniref:Uncharacterized protein n=1 Tax=Carnobacterium divergens DSM 20623 TaxID=1449336 RepID=A0A0R2I739_CARDV|nr:hypothetical protein [Carnobacterium divergens]ANZ98815.1 hypothetical protein BFC22_01320 [Carnobacterium divergens]KRN57562.1 hypothetical protein IV74_GL000082 [Carnobacterium divergens DSM 20623]MDO0875766.1 hypothetical protein [Carnobacterium divergens]TFJ45597.1 hypothetical protein CKN77_00390 [Carnobacterium divergens]TFJ53392.1 hypothetical protein CKN73_00395 [Carnobacterium divergens]